MYSCDSKAEYSVVITLVFRVTWSFRNHSNMLIWCKNIYYHQCWKHLSLFEIEIFCNIINVFLLLLINLVHSCCIKVLISLKKQSLICIFSPMPNQQKQSILIFSYLHIQTGYYISFCVPLKKQSHAVLRQHEGAWIVMAVMSINICCYNFYLQNWLAYGPLILLWMCCNCCVCEYSVAAKY